jgi:hypothetical protein
VRFAIFCKSFRDDIERFSQLLDTFEQHNRSKLPLFVSVPRSDCELFVDRVGSGRAQFVTDEEILGREVSQSWLSQQLVKLSAFRIDFADAWLLVDSDAYFIRDISLEDFVRDDAAVAMVASRAEHVFDENWDVLLSFLQNDSVIAPLTREELCVFERTRPRCIPWWSGLRDGVFSPTFASRTARAAEFFGRKGLHYASLPGAVWTKDCLESLTREVLEPHHLSFERLLRHSPWEAIWIAEWELFRGLPSRFLIHPPIAHLRQDTTIRRVFSEGLTEARLSSRYFGIQLAARHQKFVRLLRE